VIYNSKKIKFNVKINFFKILISPCFYPETLEEKKNDEDKKSNVENKTN